MIRNCLNRTYDDYEKGQVLLVSLLVLVVALTIGLSVATRTITTLRNTSAEDSSQRAFSAAEAGIEQALTSTAESNYTGNLSNNSSYAVNTSTDTGNNLLVNNGNLIIKDDAADLWLSNFPDYSDPWDGTLSIYWGNSGDNCDNPEESNTMAALEVVLIKGSKADPVLDHFAFDPCTPRRSTNYFSPVLAGGTVDGKSFAYRADISVVSGLAARIIPLYASTYIGIRGTALPPQTTFPSQGIIITSTGSSGGTKRKIVSYRTYPKAPIEFYPFLILSPK